MTIIISPGYGYVNMQYDPRWSASEFHFNCAYISLTVAHVPHRYTVYAFCGQLDSQYIALKLHHSHLNCLVLVCYLVKYARGDICRGWLADLKFPWAPSFCLTWGRCWIYLQSCSWIAFISQFRGPCLCKIQLPRFHRQTCWFRPTVELKNEHFILF